MNIKFFVFNLIKAAYGGHQECLDILLSTPNILINVQVRKMFKIN